MISSNKLSFAHTYSVAQRVSCQAAVLKCDYASWHLQRRCACPLDSHGDGLCSEASDVSRGHLAACGPEAWVDHPLDAWAASWGPGLAPWACQALRWAGPLGACPHRASLECPRGSLGLACPHRGPGPLLLAPHQAWALEGPWGTRSRHARADPSPGDGPQGGPPSRGAWHAHAWRSTPRHERAWTQHGHGAAAECTWICAGWTTPRLPGWQPVHLRSANI